MTLITCYWNGKRDYALSAVGFARIRRHLRAVSLVDARTQASRTAESPVDTVCVLFWKALKPHWSVFKRDEFQSTASMRSDLDNFGKQDFSLQVQMHFRLREHEHVPPKCIFSSSCCNFLKIAPLTDPLLSFVSSSTRVDPTPLHPRIKNVTDEFCLTMWK